MNSNELRTENQSERFSDAPSEGVERLEAKDDAAAMDRFDRIVALAREMLDSPACLLALEEDGEVVVKSATGLRALWQRGDPSTLADGLCRRALDGDQPVWIEDASAEQGGPLGALLHDGGMMSCLAVPVHQRGRPVGALAVLQPGPRLWSQRDRRRLDGFAGVISGEIDMQAVSGERDAARREAEMLAQEQAHRVKNSLAVAASLVTLSGTEADTAAEVVRIARDRIAALSAAHSMLRSREGTGDLRSMFERMLLPYSSSGTRRMALNGPALPVPNDKVTALSLIFHELATNACKYGGLGPAGRGVQLDWRAEPAGTLLIEWQEAVESAHPAAAEPEQGKGFGSRLVEMSVRQVGGTITVDDRGGGGRRVALTLPWSSASG